MTERADLPMSPGPTELPRRRVMRDDAHEQAWRSQGYFVVDAFGPDRIAELSSVVRRLYRGGTDGFHSTLQSADGEYRRRVYDEIAPLFDELLAEVFHGYESFAVSLTVKWPGAQGTLPSHQDWTMVDEEQYRTINLWCPLVPTTEHNGAIRALPASHRVLDHLRCSPANPDGFLCGANDVPLHELDVIEADLGQVVVFDQGLLHGSTANLSDEWRPAITVACKPIEAPLVHHHMADPGSWSVDVYDVDAGFFTEFTIGLAPDRAPSGRRSFYGTPQSAEEIVARSRALVAPPTVGEPGPGLCSDGTPAVHPTFADPDLQARFERDGYVVVDLVDDADIDRLRAAAERVFSGEASGMHATNMCSDTEYRRRVFDEVRPLLEPLVSPILVDHEAAAAILLMKFPGDDSQFVSHQDWTLVDETRFRAVNVWVPLVEVDQRNGTLSVVPGSHRLLHSVRCDPTYPASYSPPGWQISPDEMLPLTLRPGQAVVFDLALLHSSPPNRSESTRSAVAVTMKPRSADLLHWFLPDPEGSELEVYDVDVDFLIDFELGSRPQYPLVATVPFVPDEVSPDALRELCGAAVGGPAPPAAEASTAARLGSPVTSSVESQDPPSPTPPDVVSAPAPAGRAGHASAQAAERPTNRPGLSRLLRRWRR